MEIDQLYTQLILEESRNPAYRKDLEHATMEKWGHNPNCGDEIQLQIQVEDNQLQAISYTGHGCAISQASTSIMCGLVEHMPIDKVLEMCNDFIQMIKGELEDEAKLDELGDGIAFQNISQMPARVKCAVLPWYTLKDMLATS